MAIEYHDDILLIPYSGWMYLRTYKITPKVTLVGLNSLDEDIINLKIHLQSFPSLTPDEIHDAIRFEYSFLLIYVSSAEANAQHGAPATASSLGHSLAYTKGHRYPGAHVTDRYTNSVGYYQ